MNHSDCYKELNDSLRILEESKNKLDALSKLSGKVLEYWEQDKISEDEFNDLSDRLLDLI